MPSIIRATTASGLQIAPDNSGSLQLQTNGTTTAVTIDTSQNVGIGTTSPVRKLDVVVANAEVARFYGTNKSIDGTGNLQVFTSNSQSTDNGGTIGIGGMNGSAGAFDPWAFATLKGAKENSTSSNLAGYLAIATSSSGGTISERMRIDSSGNVLVNKTSQSNTGKLEIDYSRATHAGSNYNETSSASSCTHIAFQRGGTGVGSIQSGNNSSTSYNTSSDYRLKDNIVPMSGALDKISQLNPVNWTWKVDGTNGQGFIAHELQAIIPDCVTGEKDAVDEEGNPVYQGVDTSFLVATLTAAIQEQQTIINDLKARVTVLEAK